MGDLETQSLLSDVRTGWKIKMPRRLYVVEPITALYFLGFMASTVLNEQYVHATVAKAHGFSYDNQTSSSCAVNDSDPADKEQDKIKAEVTLWLLYLNTASTVTGVLSILMLGAYSDYVGRKTTMILPVIGSALYAFVHAVAIHAKLPIPYLFIGHAAYGLLGTYGSVLLSAFAYIADITQPQNRTIRILILEALLGLGRALGMVLVKLMADRLGLFWPYLIIFGLFLILIGCIIFFMQETVISSDEGKLISCDNFSLIGQIYFKANNRSTSIKMRIALVAVFLCAMISLGRNDVISVFLMGKPLCWDPELPRYFNAAGAAISVISGLLLIKPLSMCISAPWVVILGAASGMSSLIVLANVINSVMAWMVPVIGLLSFLCLPLLRATMSLMANPNEQGIMFATLACAEILCFLGGGVAFRELFDVTASIWSGTALATMAAIFFIVIVLMLTFRYCIREIPRVHTLDGVESYRSIAGSINTDNQRVSVQT